MVENYRANGWAVSDVHCAVASIAAVVVACLVVDFVDLVDLVAVWVAMEVQVLMEDQVLMELKSYEAFKLINHSFRSTIVQYK